MGRALYREGGPSQGGDPVPGDLPFFCLILFKPFFMIFGLFVCFPMVYLVLNTLDAFLFSFKILFQTPKDKGVSWKLNNLFESVHKINKTTPKTVTYLLPIGCSFWSIFKKNSNCTSFETVGGHVKMSGEAGRLRYVSVKKRWKETPNYFTELQETKRPVSVLNCT